MNLKQMMNNENPKRDLKSNTYYDFVEIEKSMSKLKSKFDNLNQIYFISGRLPSLDTLMPLILRIIYQLIFSIFVLTKSCSDQNDEEKAQIGTSKQEQNSNDAEEETAKIEEQKQEVAPALAHEVAHDEPLPQDPNGKPPTCNPVEDNSEPNSLKKDKFDTFDVSLFVISQFANFQKTLNSWKNYTHLKTLNEIQKYNYEEELKKEILNKDILSAENFGSSKKRRKRINTAARRGPRYSS